jgi:hypothetical protein
LEATPSAGWIYELLRPQARELKVARPAMLRAITVSKKNDRVDTRPISARYGTFIAGAIGYSMLMGLNVPVDFHRRLVKRSPR